MQKRCRIIRWRLLTAIVSTSLNLSIGLKNDVDQVADRLAHFDFAISESCFVYNECDTLLPFIRGKNFEKIDKTPYDHVIRSEQGCLQLRVHQQGELSKSCTSQNELDSSPRGTWWEKHAHVQYTRSIGTILNEGMLTIMILLPITWMRNSVTSYCAAKRILCLDSSVSRC